MNSLRSIALALVLSFAGSQAYSMEVAIDTRAAHAVLDALDNPKLSRDEAQSVAAMPENQGPIRKLREFKINVSQNDLANALYAAAHGDTVTRIEERAFFLDALKPKMTTLRALLRRIEGHPEEFQQVIERRIAAFTPPGADIELKGFVVAAGDGGGYAFGSNDFYLNLVWVDDFAQAKSVTTHELYHAVQGAFASYRRNASQSDDASTPCQALQHLFGNIYEEGSAVEVGDVSLLAQFSSANGLRQRADMEEGAKHLETSASLLEMSVASLTAKTPVPFDDVYSVGFYGHAVLYNIAYAMAHAIVETDGAAGLGEFAKRPPAEFMRRYTELPTYGFDKAHPALGANTLSAIALVGKGCP